MKIPYVTVGPEMIIGLSEFMRMKGRKKLQRSHYETLVGENEPECFDEERIVN